MSTLDYQLRNPGGDIPGIMEPGRSELEQMILGRDKDMPVAQQPPAYDVVQGEVEIQTAIEQLLADRKVRDSVYSSDATIGLPKNSAEKTKKILTKLYTSIETLAIYETTYELTQVDGNSDAVRYDLYQKIDNARGDLYQQVGAEGWMKMRQGDTGKLIRTAERITEHYEKSWYAVMMGDGKSLTDQAMDVNLAKLMLTDKGIPLGFGGDAKRRISLLSGAKPKPTDLQAVVDPMKKQAGKTDSMPSTGYKPPIRYKIG
ncbi:MAG: hypothetical protein ABIC95_02970 [archaeon]